MKGKGGERGYCTDQVDKERDRERESWRGVAQLITIAAAACRNANGRRQPKLQITVWQILYPDPDIG